MSSFSKCTRRNANKSYVKHLQQVKDGRTSADRHLDLAPQGSVLFYEHFFTNYKAEMLLEWCCKLPLTQPSYYNSFGEKINQPRFTLWFGPCDYRYYKYTLSHQSFSEYSWLDALREDLELSLGLKLNSVLVNLYRTGDDRVGWHADNVVLFGENPSIVSVSLGATRKFELASCSSKPVCKHSFALDHGSVLVMKGDMQKHWVHRVPQANNVHSHRYNLTFRNVVNL